MKIAYISQSYPPMISGAAIVAHRLAEGMAIRGHSIFVLAASDQGKAYTTEDENCRVVRLDSLPNPKRANQYFVPGSFNKIIQQIEDFHPDIVHIHDVLSMGAAGLRAARRNRIPAVATIHQLPWFVCAYLPDLPKLKHSIERILWAYSRWLNNQCETMIVPTRTISETILKQGGFKTIDISNGVDLGRFRPKSKSSREANSLYRLLGFDPAIPIILHVGRLDVEKQVDLVLQAGAEVLKQMDAQILVVGDGECRKELIELANDLGISDRCKFPGFLDPVDEIPAVYQIASVFTTASEIETQGLVLLEAMASGLPVVAVKATCIPEVIINNINGILARPGDIGAISTGLVDILSNPTRAGQMGKIGRLVAERHSIEKSMNQHEDLYQSTVEAYRQKIKKGSISKRERIDLRWISGIN